MSTGERFPYPGRGTAERNRAITLQGDASVVRIAYDLIIVVAVGAAGPARAPMRRGGRCRADSRDQTTSDTGLVEVRHAAPSSDARSNQIHRSGDIETSG